MYRASAWSRWTVRRSDASSWSTGFGDLDSASSAWSHRQKSSARRWRRERCECETKVHVLPPPCLLSIPKPEQRPDCPRLRMRWVRGLSHTEKSGWTEDRGRGLWFVELLDVQDQKRGDRQTRRGRWRALVSRRS